MSDVMEIRSLKQEDRESKDYIHSKNLRTKRGKGRTRSGGMSQSWETTLEVKAYRK